MAEFDPGYVEKPFSDLAASYPREDVYPFQDFRTEWGPIFHRGRLDGSARVLLLGQDPGQHENILRRILVGEAGRRVQGFLAKLGITRSYLLLNALLYSVYGSRGGRYVGRPAVADYRNQWIDGVFASGNVEAVITFGTFAKRAWDHWTTTPTGSAATVPVQHLTHPTQPESQGGTKAEIAASTKRLLRQWNSALDALRPAIAHPDVPIPVAPYGDGFADGDRVPIPSRDLPAGTPEWMYRDDGWAVRGLPARRPATPTEDDVLLLKRRTVVVTVPKDVIPT